MTDPSRILYYYSHQHFDTGSPKALTGMIDLLDRERFAPLFLAAADGPLLKALAERSVTIVHGPVATVSLRTPILSLRQIRRQIRLLRSHQVRLVHVNEFGRNLDLVLAAWLRRIPVVLHIHNPEVIDAGNLHWLAASRVLLVSRSVEQAVTHLHRIRRKCQVMYNFADVEAFQAARPIRDALGLRPEDLVIGMIAQMTSEKGTDLALETARLLLARLGPNLHVLMAGRVGEGADQFVEEIKRRAEDPPLAGHIHFLGVRYDIPDVLASVDLLFLPTAAETFGLVVVEAMAAGKPVVASHVGSMPELIPTPEVGRLVTPRTPAAFADAIAGVLEMPDRGRGLGERGRLSLRGRLDRAMLAVRLNEIYSSLLGAGPWLG